MKELFLAIQSRLLALQNDDTTPLINFFHVWNNQLYWMNEGKEYSIRYPAVFVEFVNSQQIDVVGGGVQQYDPLDINIHICTWFLDATDGTIEQNLNIFSIKQAIYCALQNWHCDGSGPFNRVSEQQDYDHPNIYHFVQTYRTTYVDISQAVPVGSLFRDPPLTTTLTPQILPLT